MILEENQIPMVVFWAMKNLSLMQRERMLVLPTPLSPTITTLKLSYGYLGLIDIKQIFVRFGIKLSINLMAHQLTNTRNILLQQLMSAHQNHRRQYGPLFRNAEGDSRNKQNVSLERKKVYSRIIKIEFPISKFKKQTQRANTPRVLVQKPGFNLEEKEVISIELDSNPIKQSSILTDRPKAWRMRKFSNLAQPSQVNLRRQGVQKEQHKPSTSMCRNNFVTSRKLKDSIVKDRIEGWQRESSAEDAEDVGFILKDSKRF